MQARGYVVETTLGTCLLNPGSWYFSLISSGGEATKGVYVKKKVEDLSTGELVLYRKDCIDKTLEEIEPFLEQSSRYRDAIDVLFTKNSAGKRIPVFRRDLVKAVVAQGVMSGDGLEEKILREDGKDLTTEEYTAMALHIRDRLDVFCEAQGLRSRSYSAIRGWLSGETLAPSDWKLFDALSRTLAAPVFDEYFSPSDKHRSYLRNYKNYTVTRQVLMNYLSRYGQHAKHEERERKNPTNDEHLNLTPEINIIVSQFIRDIDEQNCIARVVQVKSVPVGEKKLEELAAEPERKLRKGMVCGDEGKYLLKDFTKVAQESAVLTPLLFYAICRHMEQCDGTFSRLGADEKFRFADRLFGYLYIEERLDKPHITPLKNDPGGIKAGFTTLAKRIIGDICSGDMDATLGLPQGTLYRAYDGFRNLTRLIPEVYYLHQKKIHERGAIIAKGSRATSSERKACKELERDIQKLGQKMQLRYNFDAENPAQSKLLLESLLQKWTDLANLPVTARVSPYNIINYSEVWMDEFIDDPKLRSLLFKKHEVCAILQEHDVSAAIKLLHPNNFIFDQW